MSTHNGELMKIIIKYPPSVKAGINHETLIQDSFSLTKLFVGC